MLNSVFACCNWSVWKKTGTRKNIDPWQSVHVEFCLCCNLSVWKKTGTRKNIDPWQSVHVEFCLCCNAPVWKKTGTRKNIDPWQSVHVEFCLCCNAPVWKRTEEQEKCQSMTKCSCWILSLLVATCLCERRQRNNGAVISVLLVSQSVWSGNCWLNEHSNKFHLHADTYKSKFVLGV